MAEPGRAGRPLLQALRARAPIMAAEIVSVVFAVLLALAVDEWWEDRENAELGRRGMDAVSAEIARNLEELRDGFERTDTTLLLLDSAIVLMESDRDDVDVSINYPVALLSDAAWETAQVTRAVHYVPLEDVIDLARVYDLQAFFSRNQEALTDRIALMGLADDETILQAVRELRARYRVVVGYRQVLIDTYACTLATMAGREPQSAEDCVSGSATVGPS